MTGLVVLALSVGPVRFGSPWWLLLAPALGVAALLMARRSLSGLGARTRWLALGLRAAVIALIAGALAEPHLDRRAHDISVTLVLDVSRSIPVPTREEIDRFLAEATGAGRRDGDRLGVVTAAVESHVQALPSLLARGMECHHVGPADGTNLENAIRLAMAVLPGDSGNRIVLISDGNETAGSLLAAAEAARAINVPIDVLPVRYTYEHEVIVDELVAPATVRAGETVNLRVALTSTAPARGRLSITEGGVPIDLDPDSDGFAVVVDLDEGRNVLSVPVLPAGPGPRRYEAVYEPLTSLVTGPDGRRVGGTGDRIIENNRAMGVTFVAAEGRVLVVAPDPMEASPLVQALAESGIEADLGRADEVPASLTDLNRYDAVIMLNQAAHDYTERQQESLRRFVHDTGGGLVKIGGPDSYGAGGWNGSPIEDVLPIRLDPPQRRDLPMGALALVIDASGSMAAPVPGTGSTQQQVANEASVLGVQTLTRQDEITVVSFDGAPSVVVPLTTVGDPASISRRIRSIRPGGGTNMYPAMARAGEELLKGNAGVRHMIVLTDGVTTGTDADGRRTVNLLRSAGITVSAVSVGGMANDALLNEIAVLGGGRFYKVGSAESKDLLPQVFIREAQTVRRALVWEGDPFEPTIVDVGAPSMRGIRGVPPVRGYVVTAEREGLALVTMRGPENDPISAQWQHGLGRVVAFMSDASTRWAPGWVGWQSFRQFWEQHVRWAMRPSGEANIRVSTESRAGETVVVVEAFDTEGERLNFADFRGRVARPDGSGADVELRQVGPGRYEGAVPTAIPGTYVVNLRYRAPGADGGPPMEGSVQTAITRPFADEFRALQDNAPLLRQVAQATGGRVLSVDPTTGELWARDGLDMPVATRAIWLAVVLVAVGLFLADVAVRRVRLDAAAMLRVVRRAVGRSPARAADGLEGLRAAREAARERMRPARGERAEAASRKFEADNGAPAPTGPVALGGEPEGPDKPVKKEARAPSKAEPEDEEGLSRLMRAKQRARDEYGKSPDGGRE